MKELILELTLEISAVQCQLYSSD